MKKRILALLLALCDVMGAFATAPEGTTAEETARSQLYGACQN